MQKQKITSNRINSKNMPILDKEVLSKSQLDELIKSNDYLIFTANSLNKAREDVFALCKSNPENKDQIIEKSKSDFGKLQRKSVLLDGPQGKKIVDFFIAPKDLIKAMEGDVNINNDNDNGGEEDNDESTLSEEEREVLSFIKEALAENPDSNLQNKEISEEEGYSDEETSQIIKSLKEKGFIEVEEINGNFNITGITEDGLSSLGDEDSEEEGEEEGDEEGDDEGEGDNSEGDGTDNGLDVPKQGDDQNNDSKGDGSSASPGSSEMNTDGNKKDDSSASNMNGKKPQPNASPEVEDNDSGAIDNGGEPAKPSNAGGGENDEEDNDGGDIDNTGDEGDTDNDVDNDTDNDADNTGNEGEGSTLSDEEVKTHAKQASSDVLNKYIQSESGDENYKAIAKQELAARSKGESSEPGSNDGNEGDINNKGGEDGDIQDPAAERKEVMDWIDTYFDDHDPEDLRDYTKELILQSPKEIKILKEHYRNDYAKNNSGNKLAKTDPKEFQEWIDQYLEHQPLEHLKTYTTGLIQGNPKAFKELQSKYQDLKSNEIN